VTLGTGVPFGENRTAKLICFEGGDGVGKSTQAQLLATALDAVVTRQPGGTPLGSEIRRLLLDPEQVVNPRTEALLMAADRAQHVAEVVRPALDAGRHVVCDRYLASSVAYQGYGRGLSPGAIEELSLFAVDGVLPDLVVLLDVEVPVARERIARTLDRIEREPDEFRERVRQGFLAQAAADTERWVVIPANGSPLKVQHLVFDAVRQRLGLELPDSRTG
jgi:dTMP kinase